MSLEKQKDDEEFAIRRSVRYHVRRRAFFETCHAAVMFCIILLSSGSLVAVFTDVGKAEWCIYTGLALTVLGTIDLVIGFSRRAKDHEVLNKQFHSLLIEMQMEKPSVERLQQWKRKRLNIEAEEPPIYRALDVSCHNEEVMAMGVPKEQFKLSRCQKLFMHFLRYAGENWERI